MNERVETPYVLICDDEAHIRAVIAAKLTASGFKVLQGRNGAEGLAFAKAQTPALVITDLQMPVMSGIELAQALRDTPATSNVPVLMLTARGYTLNREQLNQTGIREVVAKPFGVKQLMDRVTALIGSPNLTAIASPTPVAAGSGQAEPERKAA